MSVREGKRGTIHKKEKKSRSAGSIRRRLTMFVVLVCLLLISLVWLLVVQLLEPMYNNSIRSSLEESMRMVVDIMEGLDETGTPLTAPGRDGTMQASQELNARMSTATGSGMLQVEERSIDIALVGGKCIYKLDTLPDYFLHPWPEEMEHGQLDTEANGTIVVQLRETVANRGQYYDILTTGQIVVGTTAVDGKYTVLVAANTERISEAIGVFYTLMPPVAVVLLIVAVLAAWIFSSWFTGPLQRLSGATRELTRGNFNVALIEEGNDEIAELSRDFNVMAKEIKRSYDMQRDLIANVSHDLRTPLTLIKGYAETVRDLTDDADKRDEQLDVIVDETDRLAGLVGKVMELSRVSSGTEKPEPVRFDLMQLLDEIAYRYAEYCAANGYTFDPILDLASEVVADPDLVERALDNLLGNALNHIGEDGYLGLHANRGDEGVLVEVIDHGPGVRQEDLPYIFDRYYRSRTDTGKVGTGLGLSITKAIFIAQGFEYGVDSKIGRGTTFWFEIPLAKKPELKLHLD